MQNKWMKTMKGTMAGEEGQATIEGWLSRSSTRRFLATTGHKLVGHGARRSRGEKERPRVGETSSAISRATRRKHGGETDRRSLGFVWCERRADQ